MNESADTVMAEILVILQFVGGAGILLFGIDIMKGALEKISENKMEKMLSALTKNRLSGSIIGAVVTIINQKSAATTAMVVGLANAGVLSLTQAAGAIMGANIGTTVTAQLLASQIGWASWAIIGIGVLARRLVPHKKWRYTGEVMIGFGMMFVGMAALRTNVFSMALLFDVQDHLRFFDEASALSYLIAMLGGFVAAAVSRSSSAMMGVVIAMSMDGLIGFDLAMPLILGINTGKCVPTLYLGGKVNMTVRRVTALQMMFYLIGDLIFVLMFRGLMENAVFWLAPENLPRQIAHAHTLFNLGNAIILLPFANLLVQASDKLILRKKGDKEAAVLNLDKRMLETPGLALAQTAHELTIMAKAAYDNYATAFRAFEHQNSKSADLISMEEDNIDRMQKEIEAYLVRLSRRELTESQRREANLYLGICADIERIGDLAENAIRIVQYSEENEINLSGSAVEEIKSFYGEIAGFCDKTVKALGTNDETLAREVLEDSEAAEDFQKRYKEAHLKRLKEGVCTPGSGIVFIDMVTDLVAIVLHLRSICQSIVESRQQTT